MSSRQAARGCDARVGVHRHRHKTRPQEEGGKRWGTHLCHCSLPSPTEWERGGHNGGGQHFALRDLQRGKRGSPKRDAQRSHRAMSEVGHQSRGGGTVASGARRMGRLAGIERRDRKKGNQKKEECREERGQGEGCLGITQALVIGASDPRSRTGSPGQVLGSLVAVGGFAESRESPAIIYTRFIGLSSPVASLAAVWDRCGDRPGVGELSESTERTRTRRRHGLASVSR